MLLNRNFVETIFIDSQDEFFTDYKKRQLLNWRFQEKYFKPLNASLTPSQ